MGMLIITKTHYHMKKKKILIGHNMDKAIRVTLLSDALPQRLRHLWAITGDLALSVAFKTHILKKREVSIMLLSCLSISKAITIGTSLSE